MRKIATTSLLVFLFFTTVQAQSRFGIKAGPGIADIVFAVEGQAPYLGYGVDDITHNLPALSWHLAAFAAFDLSNRFQFQPELHYAMQGLNYNTSYLYDDIKYRLRVSYIQAPLLISLNTSAQNKNDFFIQAGVYGGLMLREAFIKEIEGQRTKEPHPNVKRAEFGIAAGLEYDLDLPGGGLILDFRITYGLTDMMNPIEGYIPWYLGPDQLRAKNACISFLVGYRFNSGSGSQSSQRSNSGSHFPSTSKSS